MENKIIISEKSNESKNWLSEISINGLVSSRLIKYERKKSRRSILGINEEAAL